MFSLSWRL